MKCIDSPILDKSIRASTVGFPKTLLACMLLVTTCALVGGCGGSGVKTINVAGKVSFDGGPCPASGYVYFSPLSVSEGLPRRPVCAPFDTDGTFTLTSFRPGDGIVPGTYRVRLECWKTRPTDSVPGVSFIPADFTPPDVTIAPDASGTVTVAIDVPVTGHKR